MSSNREIIIFVLKQISSLIGKLSDEELEDLLNGKITINLSRKEKRKKENKKNIDEKLIEKYISQLRTFDEREKGITLLNEETINKTFLKKLARSIDIPINDRDNIKILRERIIEATIGYRLRSKAIQSNTEISFLNKQDFLKKKTTS